MAHRLRLGEIRDKGAERVQIDMQPGSQENELPQVKELPMLGFHLLDIWGNYDP